MFTIPRLNDTNYGVQTAENFTNITLNGFRNGSLQALCIYVTRDNNFRYIRNARDANLSPGLRNPLKFLPITEVTLQYGGQIVYQASDSKVAEALDAMINTTDSTYDIQYAVPTNLGFGAAAAKSDRSRYYRIQLSQFSEVFRDYIMSGANLSSDTMQLSFKVKDVFSSVAATLTQAPADITYTCHVQYVYQAALSVQKGVGSFTFVNPMPNPALPQQLQISP